MLKIRRPLGRLIFNMGIAIPGKTVFLIETAPSTLGSDNGLSPVWCQAVTGTNVDLLSNGPSGTNFSKIKALIKIQAFSFTKINVNMLSVKCQPPGLGLNMLTFMCRDQINPVQHCQHHGRWCPGSLHRKEISIHDTDLVEWLNSYLTWGKISTTYVMSMWRN